MAEAKAKVAEEAARLAGHPEHLGRAIATSAAGSTVAGVGAYQVNSAIAHKQHQSAPALNSMGTNPPTNLHITVSTAAPHRKRGN